MSLSKTKSEGGVLPSSRSASPNHLEHRRQQDPRFNPPQPSLWKRIALISLVVFLFWMAFKMRPSEPQVIYAERYSREHKYRPAASPIITERLKDGRIRVRGASL